MNVKRISLYLSLQNNKCVCHIANTKNNNNFEIIKVWGPRWQSGNTLASHLCGRGLIPIMAVSGKAGSFACCWSAVYSTEP